MSKDVKNHLIHIADEFDKAVKLRNSILHGKPATSPTTHNNTIIDKGKEWTIDELSKATIIFQDLDVKANNLLHQEFLK